MTNGMSIKDKFVVLVQTAAIVQDIRQNKAIAAAVVGDAMLVDGQCIKDRIKKTTISNRGWILQESAVEFVKWSYQIGVLETEDPIEVPSWLVWLEHLDGNRIKK